MYRTEELSLGSSNTCFFFHSPCTLEMVEENRAGEMVQSVKHYPCKHEDLSSDSQKPREPGTVVCACNPRDGEVGGRDHWVPGSLLDS